MKTLLLTGGTGYIGSHNAVVFLDAGYDIVILDNLSNSSRDVIENIQKISGKTPKFYKGDLRNMSDIQQVFRENTIDTVIHFAGLKSVGESCNAPYKYYENNVIGALNLTQVMQEYNVKKIIFSSSATVYDPSALPPFSEDTKTGNTINPYGTTKFVIENIFRDLALHKDFQVINLRYFNPIGAHSSGLIGEDPHDIPNNLLPYIMKVANKKLEKLPVFGDDYDTHDGTGVRDYIHVMDLAQGHLAAFHFLEDTQNSGVFESINLGTGDGTSVLEMIEISRKVSQQDIPFEIVNRRSGDIASAYCSAEKAKKLLKWKAEKSITEAIGDSWNFIQTSSGSE